MNWETQLRGEVRYQEPLARHTTWRIGGPADRLFIPADGEDLRHFLRHAPETEPLLWLGLGSNLLVRDGGIRGTAILTHRLNRLENLSQGRWYAEAGVACALIARHSARACDLGAEFLAGIPGSWGGALAMNAGAFGGETWELVREIIMIDRHGETRQRPPADFQVAYRHVIAPPGEYFYAARLQLQPGDAQQAAASAERIRELLQKRRDTQPTQLPSCGSVFRNPHPWFAAKLIDDCGLKGKRIGGAQVSEKHANFIINTGGARAAEVEALMALVMDTVEQRCGVRLQPEVCVRGEPL